MSQLEGNEQILQRQECVLYDRCLVMGRRILHPTNKTCWEAELVLALALSRQPPVVAAWQPIDSLKHSACRVPNLLRTAVAFSAGHSRSHLVCGVALFQDRASILSTQHTATLCEPCPIAVSCEGEDDYLLGPFPF